MKRTLHGALLGATTLALGACADLTGGNDAFLSSEALTAAFAQAPVATADLSNSYVGAGASAAGDSTGWMGRGPGGHGPGHGDLMGGGLGDAFVGGIAFGGRGGHRGPFAGFACAGTFNAASGRVECASQTLRNGLTVARSIAYADAAGAAQQAFDTTTTNTINVRSQVSGTVTFSADGAHPFHDAADSVALAAHPGGPGGGGPGGPGGPGGRHGGPGGSPLGRLFGDTATLISASVAVQNASDRTVSGLAASSPQRTAGGTSAGQETTTGVSSRGSFTVVRVTGDTTTGLVIPVSTIGPSYPTAGTVVRSMRATLTYDGQAAVEASRREVVTYDGTATAKVVITENGVTRSCTRALPRGQLFCQ
jgi:hypothetical protein